MTKQWKILGVGLLAVIGVATTLTFRSVRNVLPFPLFLKHTLNLLFHPKDLYEPIVLDDFRIWEAGFSKSYNLQPRYADFHEVGLADSGGRIPASYSFNGELKLSFACDGNLVREASVNSMGSGLYADTTLTHFKEVSLFEFPIPLDRRCDQKELLLTVTVIKPDQTLKLEGVSPRLYVAVSATP